MRVLALALGAVAAVGFTAAVAAGQATDHIQLAQAQNTGAQPGAGTGATQQGSSETVQAAPPQHPVQRAAAGLQCEQTRGAVPGRPFASALRVPVCRYMVGIAERSACAPLERIARL